MTNLSPTEYSACTLCPRKCRVDRYHSRGFCGEGASLRVARAALHPWEEPCLTGKNGSGTVFFSGCGLKCLYCQNHEIAIGSRGREITIPRLAEIFTELQAKGAANINLVTATQFLPSILPALRMAKERGLSLPVVYNSGGYESVETLKMLDGYVDIYLPDFKYMSSELSRRFSHAPDYPQIATAAIDEMLCQTGKPMFDGNGQMKRGVIVRHLVLPSHTDDSENVLRFLHERYGDRIYISIMNQYTPCIKNSDFPELSRKLTTYEYEKITKFAASIGVQNGFIQYGETAEASFIPPFDETGI